MSILVSVLIIFIFIELYNTYSIVKGKIIEFREKRNNIELNKK